MAWPASYDASFPGYPYVDDVEYVLATYANSWVAAIQSLEQGIGSGSGPSANNPLYSVQYNKYYSTITARIAAIETVATGGIRLNTAAGNIQPISSVAAQAGNTGLAADAGHVHLGASTAPPPSAVFTAAGQILVGTGFETGELLSPGAAGSVLTVGGGDASGLEWTAGGGWSPGDFKFTAAFNPGDGWLLANGAAVSRSSYAALMAAITLSFNGTASGSTISGLSSNTTAVLAAGMAIEGPGLGANATISGVSATSIMLSSNPTAGVGNFIVFPNDNGDGGTTFQLPDMRGRVPVGANGPGGNNQPLVRLGGSTYNNLPGEATHSLTSTEGPSHYHSASGGVSISDAGHYHNVQDNGHTHPNSTTGTELAYPGGGSGTHTHSFGFNMAIVTNSQPQTTWLSGSGTNWASWTPDGTSTQPENTPHMHATNTPLSRTGILIYPNTQVPNNTGISATLTNLTVGTAGSGAAHNNMQPFLAGQWFVHT